MFHCQLERVELNGLVEVIGTVTGKSTMSCEQVFNLPEEQETGNLNSLI